MDPQTIMTYESSEVTKSRAKQVRQVWAVLVAISLIVFLLGALVMKINYTQDTITQNIIEAKEATQVNREFTLKNRGISCQVLITLGERSLPEACAEPDSLRYYNPLKAPTAGGDSPGQIKNRQMLCLMLRIQGQEPPNCMDASAPVPGF